METHGFDSRRWTGDISVPPPPAFVRPPPLVETPRLTRAQIVGMGHALCLFLSPLSLLLASLLVTLSARDMLLIQAPSLVPFGIVACVAGLCLLNAIYENHRPRFFGRISQAGWLIILGIACHHGFNGLASQRAPAGPVLRAQVAGIEGGRNRPTRVSIALADGSTALSEYFSARRYARNGQCLSVRRLSAPSGFAWLRIIDASPVRGGGALNWPIERAACFTARDLFSLGS